MDHVCSPASVLASIDLRLDNTQPASLSRPAPIRLPPPLLTRLILTPANMRFVVRLHSFSCSLPSSPSSTSPARPFLRLNFDGYKKLSTKPLPSALAASAALVFSEAFTFQYETNYPQKLHQKQLTVKLYTHNVILADTLIGQASINLHTIATGPIVHDLPLVDAGGKAAGRVRLTVEMEQLVNMSLHLQSVSLSALPTIQGKAPVSHLSYGYTGLDSKHFKTDKLSNTVTPEWSGATQLHPVKFHTATVKELWREGVEMDVMIKRKRGEKSHKCGSVLIRLASHHSFVDKAGLSVVERLHPTPDYAQLQCMVRLHFYYEGVASYVQMSKGRHDEKGVHDGQPFAEGLPLPSTQFYKTTVQHPPALPQSSSAPAAAAASAAAAPVASASSAPDGATVRRGSIQASALSARQRERSVMSIRAAREYDGASVIRTSYNYRSDDDDDDDGPQRSRNRAPPRAASVLGTVDSTASASNGSKGLSRSSSSGSIAASAATSGSRTPNSQRRYLAYPPPPISEHGRHQSLAGPPGGAVGVRGVSFDSQVHSQGGRDLTPTSQRRRDSAHFHIPASSAPVSPSGGVTGYCAMCGRPSNQFCNETLQPVCSPSCTAKALIAAGLPAPLLDDEKNQRPPPLNPSVYPLLSPSASHRQPGPAGFCVVCQHPALYLCKDTLVPVCSAECKIVHLKINPHLKQPTAPTAPSRTSAAAAAGPSAGYGAMDGGGLAVQPPCVECGRKAEFRCSVSNDSVCSVECKQANLARAARRPRISPSSSPVPPSPAAAAASSSSSSARSCPACTYVNVRGAAVCDMCGGGLTGSSRGVSSGSESPRAPVYHLYQNAPGVPKRPSFAAVGGGDLRAVPGGPAAR